MEDMKLVKCLKCNKLGHTNCYQYPDMIPNIYKKLWSVWYLYNFTHFMIDVGMQQAISIDNEEIMPFP